MGKNFRAQKKEHKKNWFFLVSFALESLALLLFFVFIGTFFSGFNAAVTFNCSIVNASNCTGTGNITVFRLMNSSNGFFNAHVQNASLSGYSPIYNYSVCCYSDSTLDTNCNNPESIVIKMFNWTNAHIQMGNHTSTPAYSYSSCLSVEIGKISCDYPKTSCSGSQICLASMASSNSSTGNVTDAHVGPCSEYQTKICCEVNSPPVISNVVLNSSFGTNYSHENLTVYFSESDIDGDSYTNITDWRKNGTSIAVLNMPFNTNVSVNTSRAVRDYSTYGNNGTLGGGISANMPTWTSSGKVGGAYTFDGVNDFISGGNLSSLNLQNAITLSAWVNPLSFRADPDMSTIVTKAGAYYFQINGSGSLQIYHYGVTPAGYHSSNSPISLDSWQHVAYTYNGSVIRIYINSALDRSIDATGNIASSSSYLGIGANLNSLEKLYPGYERKFNGTIDEVQIFNYSLSANQILDMYNEGLANHSVQTIHSDETTKGEIWSVALTPNDGNGDGTTVLSNNLTIKGSIPNVTLISPPNWNASYSRTPTFLWSVAEYDGDSISYEINVSAQKISGSFNCLDALNKNISNLNYTPTSDLKCFYDNGYVYNWSVRANDTDGQGNWTPVWAFNMTAIIDISMPTDFISFGSKNLLDSDDTSDDNPAPFIIQNDGNALVNVSINATNLWSSVSNPSSYYRFKIDNSSELFSFNWSLSNVSWTQLPLIMQYPGAIDRLKYQNTNDSAEVDIAIQVPPGETQGSKTSVVTLMSILAE